MTDDVYEGEDKQDVTDALLALSNAIEAILKYASTSEEMVFTNPNTINFLTVQVLAQLLANHLDLFPADQRQRAFDFSKEQQDLVYQIRSKLTQETAPETPIQGSEDDPYGLAAMAPKGRA